MGYCPSGLLSQWAIVRSPIRWGGGGGAGWGGGGGGRGRGESEIKLFVHR